MRTKFEAAEVLLEQFLELKTNEEKKTWFSQLGRNQIVDIFNCAAERGYLDTVCYFIDNQIAGFEDLTKKFKYQDDIDILVKDKAGSSSKAIKLSNLQIIFLMASDYPQNSQAHGYALAKLKKLKEKHTYQEDYGKLFGKFFIDYGLAEKFNISDMFLQPNLGTQISHSINCYGQKAVPLLVSMFPLWPLILSAGAGAVVSGVINNQTREPLRPEELKSLFLSLKNICRLGRLNQREFIKKILEKYGDREWNPNVSIASKQLCKTLRDSHVPLRVKWRELIFYITDTEKNNGKLLFNAIAETAKNFLTNRYGFNNVYPLHHFFQSNNLNKDVIEHIHRLTIDVNHNEIEKSFFKPK